MNDICWAYCVWKRGGVVKVLSEAPNDVLRHPYFNFNDIFFTKTSFKMPFQCRQSENKIPCITIDTRT